MIENQVVDMHVYDGVNFMSGIVRINDYSDIITTKNPKNFVGMVLSTGSVIHIPLDRGEKMAKLAHDVLAAWKSDLTVEKTQAAINLLFYKANLAVMISVQNAGKPNQFTQYRLYDAGDQVHTWKTGGVSKSDRRRVPHQEALDI